MKKLVGISLFVFWAFVAAILTAGLVFYQNNKNSPAQNSILNLATNDPAQEKETALDAAEIAKHNSANNCWIIINDKVYNVSSYLGAHPGGAATIAPYCGKEASNAFTTKDTGSSHSANANSMLASYYIGDLNQKIGASQTAQNVQSAASSQSKASLSDPAPVAQPSPAPAGQTTLNMAEIAKHNSTGNCWIIISGKIYNATNYLRAHPGGSGTITPYCGKDATPAFQGQGHSSYANSLLASYYIGDLNQSAGSAQVEQNIQNTNNAPPPAKTREDDDEYEDD